MVVVIIQAEMIVNIFCSLQFVAVETINVIQRGNSQVRYIVDTKISLRNGQTVKARSLSLSLLCNKGWRGTKL